MGGIFKAAANIVSAPANIINSIPVVGPIAGPAFNIASGNYLAAAGQIAGNAAMGNYSGGGGSGGGGGSPTYGSTVPGAEGSGTTTPFYSPTYNYGANSYSVDNNPFDTSKYFLQGNKGTYNLLPELSNLYGNQDTQQRAGAPSANIYGDIMNKFSMNQDTLAQQNFQKNFGLQSYNPNTASPTTLASDFNAPDYLKSDIQNALGEYYPSGSTQTDSIPVNYADFGFKQGDTLQNIANYAKQQNNPFFMPYAPGDVRPEVDTRPPPIMPVSSNPTPAFEPFSYKPVADARGPAPRDLAPASVASSGTYRTAEAPSANARTSTTEPIPGAYKPVNIRTGGLASLRRKA
jgi:hypothetical protein